VTAKEKTTAIQRAHVRALRKRFGTRVSVRAWLAIPTGNTARRLTLLGLAVALQNVLELPRDALIHVFGAPMTSLLVMLALAASLGLILTALRPRVPTWSLLRARPVQALVLLATLAAVPLGLRQLGAATVAGFQAPSYPNDGTTLDHEAAIQLLQGHNPYVTTDIVTAVRDLGQDPTHTTPLRRGAFAQLPPTQYPSKAALRSTLAAEPAGRPDEAIEFESHVSYPALAFLPLVPLVKLGLPSVVPFFLLCFLALAALALLAVPAPLRLWVALLVLADAPLLDATAAGDLDVFYLLLLFAAWLWWRRPVGSTIALGLACAAKQLAWFYLPFYFIRVGRELGWREASKRAAGAGAIFAAINLPFLLNNPRAWLAGVAAPLADPMFPAGNGLIRLSLAGFVPLAPSTVYAVLEALAFCVCLAWYWRYGRRMPEAGFVLAVLPLFFAWRSLTTYFYFVGVPAVVLWLARQHETRAALSPLAAGARTALVGAGNAAEQSAFQRNGRLPRRLRWRRQ
jgi:hypothetical protein